MTKLRSLLKKITQKRDMNSSTEELWLLNGSVSDITFGSTGKVPPNISPIVEPVSPIGSQEAQVMEQKKDWWEANVTSWSTEDSVELHPANISIKEQLLPLPFQKLDTDHANQQYGYRNENRKAIIATHYADATVNKRGGTADSATTLQNKYRLSRKDKLRAVLKRRVRERREPSSSLQENGVSSYRNDNEERQLSTCDGSLEEGRKESSLSPDMQAKPDDPVSPFRVSTGCVASIIGRMEDLDCGGNQFLSSMGSREKVQGAIDPTSSVLWDDENQKKPKFIDKHHASLVATYPALSIESVASKTDEYSCKYDPPYECLLEDLELSSMEENASTLQAVKETKMMIQGPQAISYQEPLSSDQDSDGSNVTGATSLSSTEDEPFTTLSYIHETSSNLTDNEALQSLMLSYYRDNRFKLDMEEIQRFVIAVDADDNGFPTKTCSAKERDVRSAFPKIRPHLTPDEQVVNVLEKSKQCIQRHARISEENYQTRSKRHLIDKSTLNPLETDAKLVTGSNHVPNNLKALINSERNRRGSEPIDIPEPALSTGQENGLHQMVKGVEKAGGESVRGPLRLVKTHSKLATSSNHVPDDLKALINNDRNRHASEAIDIPGPILSAGQENGLHQVGKGDENAEICPSKLGMNSDECFYDKTLSVNKTMVIPESGVLHEQQNRLQHALQEGERSELQTSKPNLCVGRLQRLMPSMKSSDRFQRDLAVGSLIAMFESKACGGEKVAPSSLTTRRNEMNRLSAPSCHVLQDAEDPLDVTDEQKDSLSAPKKASDGSMKFGKVQTDDQRLNGSPFVNTTAFSLSAIEEVDESLPEETDCGEEYCTTYDGTTLPRTASHHCTMDEEAGTNHDKMNTCARAHSPKEDGTPSNTSFGIEKKSLKAMDLPECLTVDIVDALATSPHVELKKGNHVRTTQFSMAKHLNECDSGASSDTVPIEHSMECPDDEKSFSSFLQHGVAILPIHKIDKKVKPHVESLDNGYKSSRDFSSTKRKNNTINSMVYDNKCSSINSVVKPKEDDVSVYVQNNVSETTAPVCNNAELEPSWSVSLQSPMASFLVSEYLKKDDVIESTCDTTKPQTSSLRSLQRLFHRLDEQENFQENNEALSCLVGEHSLRSVSDRTRSLLTATDDVLTQKALSSVPSDEGEEDFFVPHEQKKRNTASRSGNDERPGKGMKYRVLVSYDNNDSKISGLDKMETCTSDKKRPDHAMHQVLLEQNKKNSHKQAQNIPTVFKFNKYGGPASSNALDNLGIVATDSQRRPSNELIDHAHKEILSCSASCDHSRDDLSSGQSFEDSCKREEWENKSLSTTNEDMGENHLLPSDEEDSTTKATLRTTSQRRKRLARIRASWSVSSTQRAESPLGVDKVSNERPTGMIRIQKKALKTSPSFKQNPGEMRKSPISVRLLVAKDQLNRSTRNSTTDLSSQALARNLSPMARIRQQCVGYLHEEETSEPYYL